MAVPAPADSDVGGIRLQPFAKDAGLPGAPRFE